VPSVTGGMAEMEVYADSDPPFAAAPATPTATTVSPMTSSESPTRPDATRDRPTATAICAGATHREPCPTDC
jgi:hypothetical protein